MKGKKTNRLWASMVGWFSEPTFMSQQQKFLGICFSLLVSIPALGEQGREQDDAAEKHHESGVGFFQKGLLEEARIEFTAAYQLSKRPAILFNLAKVAEKQGKREDCRSFAQSYQAELTKQCTETKECGEDADLVELLARCAPQPPVGPARVASSPKKKTPVLPIVLLSTGAASLVSSLACSLATGPINERVRQPITLADYSAAQLQGGQLNVASASLLGIGLALGISGATWLLVWRYGGQHKTP